MKNIFHIILLSIFLTSCFGGGEEAGGGSTANNDRSDSGGNDSRSGANGGSDSNSGGSTTIDSFLFSNAVASVSELTSCSSSNQGQIYYISSTEEFRGCNGTNWVSVNISQRESEREYSFILPVLTTGNSFCWGHSVYETGSGVNLTGGSSPFLALRSGVIKKVTARLINYGRPGSPASVPARLSFELGVVVNQVRVEDSNFLLLSEDYNPGDGGWISGDGEIGFDSGDIIGFKLNRYCDEVYNTDLKVVITISYEYSS